MSLEGALERLGFRVAGDLFLEERLREKGHEIQEYWQSIAPVFGETGRDERRSAPPQDAAGAYRDSIEVSHPSRNREGDLSLRVGTDYYTAVWIEVGSRHHPEDAPATKTAAYFGDDAGPVISAGGHDVGINEAQHKLRGELEHLAKLEASGAAAHEISSQRRNVEQARVERSAAFRANRPRRGRRRK